MSYIEVDLIVQVGSMTSYTPPFILNSLFAFTYRSFEASFRSLSRNSPLGVTYVEKISERRRNENNMKKGQ